MNYLTCLLCGEIGPQVRVRLVEWREPSPKQWESLPTCLDRAACKKRVIAAGDEWPLREPIQDEIGL